jgi:hypothetical protein
LNNQTKTLAGEYQYTLSDKQGEPVDTELVTVNTEKLSLIVKIQKVKEIQVIVDIINGGGATTENCTITVDTNQIQISGADTLLENLDSLTIGTINLGEIMEDQTLTFPIVLPDGVTNQTGVEQVTVDIKLPKLKTKTLKVTNIQAVNVPEGLKATIVTKTLQVTVRGSEKSIKAIQATDLSVVINLAEAQEGSVTMKADVVIGESFADVGTIGTYQVSVNLRK